MSADNGFQNMSAAGGGDQKNEGDQRKGDWAHLGFLARRPDAKQTPQT